MARTKQNARRSTGGKAPRKQLGRPCHLRMRSLTPCYDDRRYGKRHIPESRKRRHSQRPKSHLQDTASSKIIAQFKRPKFFPHFVKLPREIQYRIWEMSAEEPRIVPINSKTKSGLYSPIPPILHVCSESRAVGLKHYTLAFERNRFDHSGNETPKPRINGVYFNFERDMLYFREKWNKNAQRRWCCLSQLRNLVNKCDLERVRRVGLDVNTRVCSLETSAESCHPPDFAYWDALEILYLGYEDVELGSDCPITTSELESKDYEGFMQRYKKNPCWINMHHLLQDVEAANAIEVLRNEVPSLYHGLWRTPKPDGFLRKFELVSIKHL